MTKTDIGIYRGLREKFDPEVHVGFYIASDTGELLIGDQSLGQTISDWSIDDGVLTLTLNTGEEIKVTLEEASETKKGLLSAADKAQLNALAGNLNGKVDKVTGKSLVADSEIEKLAGLPTSTDLTSQLSNAKSAGDTALTDINAHKQNVSNPHQVTAAQVGLGNLTNDAQVKRSEMGVANGVATLDENGKVPSGQLPSYVDDIIDVYATYSKSDTGVLSNIVLYSDAAKTKTVTGEAGKIYQNVAAGEPSYQFRWTGTVFAQTGASSLIIGEVAGTAYDGAKGKANADNIAKVKGTSLSHIKDTDNVTTAADKVSINYECYLGDQYGATGTAHTVDLPVATTEKAGVMSAADKVKLEGVGTAITTAVNALDAEITSTDGTNVQVKVTEVDGKITAVNITKDDTAKNADITAEVTRATTAEGELQTAIDNHKADADKKHIPAGGHERQILAWEADGKAKWDDLANMFTGLEELLAYGIEWDVTVADPHATRIGNMSLHKTLPIQSQLKGCIAQKDKVIYWLDEKDWRFRKDATTIAVDLTESTETFAVPSVAGLGINQWLRSGDILARITAIDTEASTITVEWVLPETDLVEGAEETETDPIDLTTITSLEVGSRLDGYDGTVRVYCPNFYIKSQIVGNKRRVWLSTVKIDNTWTYQHEILIDAYRCTVLRLVPENMGYLSTLPANSAISVVNTNAYCRGLSNQSNLDANLAKKPFNTALGKPAVNISRSNMRIYCRNAGNEMLSYEQYKNIFYWLWVVEYANFNSQEAYNSELTTEGYHQGGMGPGVTENKFEANVSYGLIPCGYMNEFGNYTGIKEAKFSNNNVVKVPRWRGFENPFGDIWTNLDGCIHNKYIFYVINDPLNYTDSMTDIATKADRAVEECHRDGHYYKEFNIGDSADIVPLEGSDSGSATTYKCDYHLTASRGPHTLIVGGDVYNGAGAGLGDFYSSGSVSLSNVGFGFRSVSRFVSFLVQE